MYADSQTIPAIRLFVLVFELSSESIGFLRLAWSHLCCAKQIQWHRRSHSHTIKCVAAAVRAVSSSSSSPSSSAVDSSSFASTRASSSFKTVANGSNDTRLRFSNSLRLTGAPAYFASSTGSSADLNGNFDLCACLPDDFLLQT
jgi:hypothetical protein